MIDVTTLLGASEIQSWTKRGADDYHADKDPLFSRDRKGRITVNSDRPPEWLTYGDMVDAVGGLYLNAWYAESAKYQNRVTA